MIDRSRKYATEKEACTVFFEYDVLIIYMIHLFDLLDDYCIRTIFECLGYWDARVLRRCSRRFAAIWRALPWCDPMIAALKTARYLVRETAEYSSLADTETHQVLISDHANTFRISREQAQALPHIRNAIVFMNDYEHWLSSLMRHPKYMSVRDMYFIALDKYHWDMNYTKCRKIKEAYACMRQIMRASSNKRYCADDMRVLREKYGESLISVALRIADQLRQIMSDGKCDLVILEEYAREKRARASMPLEQFILNRAIEQEIKSVINRYARAKWIAQWPASMFEHEWARLVMYACRSPDEMCAAIRDNCRSHYWTAEFQRLGTQKWYKILPIYRVIGEKLMQLARDNNGYSCLPMCVIMSELYHDRLISRDDVLAFGRQLLVHFDSPYMRESAVLQLSVYDRTIKDDLEFTPTLEEAKRKIDLLCEYVTVLDDVIAAQMMRDIPVTFENLCAMLKHIICPHSSSLDIAIDIRARIRAILRQFLRMEMLTDANRARLNAIFAHTYAAPHRAEYTRALIAQN